MVDDLISCVSEKRNVQKNSVKTVYDINSELCSDLCQDYEFPRALSTNSLNHVEEFNKTSVFGDVSTHI